jgi:hypothetical protein
MKRKIVFRLLVVFFVIFLMASISYYNVWVKGDQNYIIHSSKNYVYLKNQTEKKGIVSEYNRSANFVTYGTGIQINAYFYPLSSYSNVTMLGFVQLISCNSDQEGRIIDNATVTNTTNSVALCFNVPSGNYKVISFVDYYFYGINNTTLSKIEISRPGNSGIVSVLLPFPETLFISLVLSGISTVVLFTISIIIRKDRYHLFD